MNGAAIPCPGFEPAEDSIGGSAGPRCKHCNAGQMLHPQPRPPVELRADPARAMLPSTGFFVRAHDGERFRAVDIAHLDARSAVAWLLSREHLALKVLCRLFGHDAEEIERLLLEKGTPPT